jgi:hypothetical protein
VLLDLSLDKSAPGYIPKKTKYLAIQTKKYPHSPSPLKRFIALSIFTSRIVQQTAHTLYLSFK